MIVLVSGLAFAISPEQQAKICAKENFPHYLEIIKPVYADFGLSSEDQLNNAVLGEPINNFVIDPSKFTADKAVVDQMQPHAFYVLPVIVDGKNIMDFTVVLNNGQWGPVDIGGRLTKIIDEVATDNNFDPEQTKILRFAGQTLVLVSKDGNVFAYLPYTDLAETGLKARQIIPESELGNVLEAIRDSYLKNISNSDGEKIYGGTYKIAPFKQNSILKRLINYCEYVREKGIR
jgi:hypothetical protein